MRVGLILFCLLLIKCSFAPQKTLSVRLPDKNAFEYYTESIDSVSSQSYESALKLIQQAIQLNPNFAKFYHLEGDIYIYLSQPDSALKSYLKATDRRSNSVDVYIKIATIYEQEFLDYDSAIAFYRRALAVDNSKLELLLNIASCYLENNQIQLAQAKVEEYQKLLEAENYQLSFDYYFLSGKIFYLQHDYDYALKLLNEAIHLKPKHFQSRLLFAKTLFKLEKYEEGLRHINQLLNYDNQVGELYFYRGVYYYHKKNFQDALTLFDIALKLDENLLEAHYYLGNIYEALKQFSEALTHYRKYRESMEKEESIIEIETKINKILTEN